LGLSYVSDIRADDGVAVLMMHAGCRQTIQHVQRTENLDEITSHQWRHVQVLSHRSQCHSACDTLQDIT